MPSPGGADDTPIRQFLQLTAREAMNDRMSEIPVLEADSDLDSVLSVLRAGNHVWIVEDKKGMRLLGVIELVEVLRYFLPPEDLGVSFPSLDVTMRSFHRRTKPAARDIMDDAVSCDPGMQLREVIKRMVRLRVRRIAVTGEGGQLMGEITQKGLIQQFYLYYRYR